MKCLFFFLFQIIAEGANGPTTPDADKIFLENNVMVIPVSTHPHALTHTWKCKLEDIVAFGFKQ